MIINDSEIVESIAVILLNLRNNKIHHLEALSQIDKLIVNNSTEKLYDLVKEDDASKQEGVTDGN